MKALIRGPLHCAVLAISVYASAVFLWPGLAWARPGDTCPSNTGVINTLTICVAPEQRVGGGCGPCVPPGLDPNVCPISSAVGTGKCCSNLSEAVFMAGAGDTIGVFDGPSEEPAVAGVSDVGPNVTITGPYGSPFRSNLGAVPHRGLRIEECHDAKIIAGDPTLPVIDIKPGAGNVIINGIDVSRGSAGIVVENSGNAAQPGTVLKAIRAEENFAGPLDLTQLFTGLLTLTASSSFPGFPPDRAVDDDLDTSWFADDGNACNLGDCPSFEIEFPQDVTVSELQMFGNREFPVGFDFLAGTFELLSAGGAVLFSSGVVALPGPDRDVTIALSCPVAKVRRVRFTATQDESSDPGFAELKVFGFASGSGAGIEVRGNGNEVSGSTAGSNGLGFLVSGSSNLVRSNRGNGNIGEGFCIAGNFNDVRGNEANSNGGTGFDLTGSLNLLRSNQSNRSSQGGAKENGGCEYSFANNTTQDSGGNKKDNANFVGTIPGSPKRYAAGCYE